MDSAQKKKSPKPKTLKKAKKITPEYLHNSGLYYLQRFSASSHQFRTVMLRKAKKSCLQHTDQNYETCAEMIEDVIAKFLRAGLLNDELYTQGTVNSLRRSGKSKNAILMKLKTRGIPSNLTLEKLEFHDSQHEENGDILAALTLCRKKRLGPFNQGKPENPEKSLATLARAGFSYDTAQQVLKMNREDAEEILNKN